MNIVAFGASASKKSINKQFATFVLHQFEGNKVILDLNDYPLPLYTVDLEADLGIPENAKSFYCHIQLADLLIISLAEHNGTYTTAFKNLFDWLSRHEVNMFSGKKIFLLSTSPGARGGLGSMEAALIRFPIHGANILDKFSLPKFFENFSNDLGITNDTLKKDFDELVSRIKSKL